MITKTKKYIYTPLWVRVFTITLFMFFLVIGVITIIYVQGNVIDIKEGEIISTGSIRINSNTSGFKVYLNNEESLVNDSQVNSIKPGEYVLRVEKEGYSSFETIIEVTEGLITSTNVQLFPEDVSTSSAISSNVSKIKFDQNNSIALYITDAGSAGSAEIKKKSFNTSLFSIVSSDETSITKADSELFNLFNEGFDDLLFSPNASSVLIKDLEGKFYVVPINANLAQVPLATAYLLDLAYTVDNVSWLSENKLVILTGTVLYQYNIKSSELTLIDLDQNIASFKVDSFKEKVYFIRNSDVFVFEDNTSKKLLLPIADSALDKGPEHKSIEFAKDNILITSTPELLYFFQLEYNTFQSLEKLELKLIDSGGKNIIAQKQESLVSLQVLETPVNNSMQIRTSVLDKSLNEVDLSSALWANDGSFFIYKLKAENTKLYSSDPQANQAVVIFESLDEQITNDFLIASNKESILLVTEITDTNQVTLSVKRLDIK